MSKQPLHPFGGRDGARTVAQVEVTPKEQAVLDAALEKAVSLYLHKCEMAEKVRLDPTDEHKRWDGSAHERHAGSLQLLGHLLDVYGYDVRMDGSDLPGKEPTSFIQWTKTEREVILYGYAEGLIDREHMLAWFDRNQENGWLRHDKVGVPA